MQMKRNDLLVWRDKAQETLERKIEITIDLQWASGGNFWVEKSNFG